VLAVRGARTKVKKRIGPGKRRWETRVDAEMKESNNARLRSNGCRSRKQSCFVSHGVAKQEPGKRQGISGENPTIEHTNRRSCREPGGTEHTGGRPDAKSCRRRTVCKEKSPLTKKKMYVDLDICYGVGVWNKGLRIMAQDA